MIAEWPATAGRHEVKAEIVLLPHQPSRRSSVTATDEDLADWENRQGFMTGGTCLWNDTVYPWGTIVRIEGRRYRCDCQYWVLLDDG